MENPKKLKVIALISGGKDSIYNIIQCIKHGHEVVAVANLYASDQGKEQDSYMYQSVGTNVAVYIAQALDLPLFRKEI